MTWVDTPDGDLVKKIEETGRICRIGTSPPEVAHPAAKNIRQCEKLGPGLSPAGSTRSALNTFALIPPDMAAGHLFIDAVLSRRDHFGKERESLLFETLLTLEGSAFAGCVAIGFRFRPGAESHQFRSPFDRAAVERMRMAAVMLPACQAASA
ncbi:hypothetical protein GCM10023067_59980 [Aminobacter aganoensis]